MYAILVGEVQVTPAFVRAAIEEVTVGIQEQWPQVASAAVQTTGYVAVYDQITALIKDQVQRLRTAVRPSSGK
jgi:hypothetical protein